MKRLILAALLLVFPASAQEQEMEEVGRFIGSGVEGLWNGLISKRGEAKPASSSTNNDDIFRFEPGVHFRMSLIAHFLDENGAPDYCYDIEINRFPRECFVAIEHAVDRAATTMLELQHDIKSEMKRQGYNP